MSEIACCHAAEQGRLSLGILPFFSWVSVRSLRIERLKHMVPPYSWIMCEIYTLHMLTHTAVC
jgi:hypothetical protein